jgi:predicted MFS family arabinose efflux permease
LIAGLGSEVDHLVTIGLFLLGLGWSAATVSGSALLSVSLPVEQKTNVQGLSDSLMNLSGALGGALAGTVVALYMFTGLNLVALVPVVTIVILSVFAARYRANRSKEDVLANLPAHE